MTHKKIFGVLMALLAACTFTLAACTPQTKPQEPPEHQEEEKPAAPSLNAEVWTLPSSAKVLRGEDCSALYTDEPALNFTMAQNEYESMQLMITPEEDVSAYSLEVSDLKGEGSAVIPAEDIEVYNEFYVEIKLGTAPNSTRPAGWYPDALVPQDISAKFGENTIAAGDNQGIWINLRSQKDTPAGTYTGTFTLHLDDTEKQIPVTAEVWDFAIPDEVHARNSFNLFQDELSNGQFDNTKESYQYYVDYLLDYRVTTSEIVSPEYSMDDWVELIKKYAADPRVTSYNIHGSGYFSKEKLQALIENSTPELNLVEKAYFYLYDEPFSMMDTAREGYYNKIDELIILADSYTEEELASYGLTRDDILGVEVLITLTASIDTIDGLRTYCPLVSDFNTQEMRDMYEDFRQHPYLGKNNELEGTDYGTTWWYVCVQPYDPYPNINIDMDLNTARVLSWMQYQYDIEGLVYWGTMTYFSTATRFDEYGQKPVNVYDQANGVFAGANGDGYILYPGAKYGMTEPIPTMRLMELRDGFEEYEFLYLLEQMTNDALEQTGLSGSFDDMMADIYASMYTGVITDPDYTLVLDARQTVADMILAIAQNPAAVGNYL